MNKYKFSIIANLNPSLSEDEKYFSTILNQKILRDVMKINPITDRIECLACIEAEEAIMIKLKYAEVMVELVNEIENA